MKCLGVFKIGDQYSALIRTEKEKSVFKVNDDIEGFTIMEIHEDQIILKKSDMSFTLKRGGKQP